MNTLRRPMFRRGGSTGEGITSGLRRGFTLGGSGAQRDYLKEKETIVEEPTPEKPDSDFLLGLRGAPSLPKSSRLNDFLINFGLNMVGNAPSGNIFQTAAKEAQDPFAKFQQQRSQDELLKYKHAQGERQFQLEIYKALNPDDQLKIQKEMKWYMEQGMSKEDAFDAVMYRKPMHPKERERLEKQKEGETYAENIRRIQEKVADEAGEDIPEYWAKHISDFYDWAEENSDKYKIDNTNPFIDFMSGTYEYDDSGNIVLGEDMVTDYIDGTAYVDPNTGKIYYKEKGSARLVLIDQDEEIIE